MRTNVYADGFNLYYGCLKGTGSRWLDLDALCRRLLPHNEIHRIRYFTARVAARPGDPDGPTRQEAYLRALATIPHLSIHFGRFQLTTARMPLAAPRPGGPRTVEVIKTEEKGSDVNLATYLILDAVRADCEMAVVVSNDSDLAEPVRVVIHELGVPVGLVNPHPARFRSRELLNQRPAFFKQIWARALQASQFPVTLPDKQGEIRRPTTW